MANNRMFFVCRQCGEGIKMATYYPNRYKMVHEDFNARVEAFMDEHSYACKGDFDVALENQWQIRYEFNANDGSETDYHAPEFQ